MQLVAYGAQDIYLTGNPQITFFKVVYRRHTNFSMESISQTLNGGVSTDGRSTCTISRNGDLVHKIYLQSVLAADTTLNEGVTQIKSVELEIGGQRIDRHLSAWMEAWAELTENKTGIAYGSNFQQTTGMGAGALCEDARNAVTAQGGTAQADSRADVFFSSLDMDSQIVYTPLQFWFCRNPGLALPLIALQYHEVKVIFNWSTVLNSGHELWVDYIYLDTDERRRFAQVSHEYLIEQVQHQTVAASSSSIDLNFNHPVKELVLTGAFNTGFALQSALITNELKLSLNGHDLLHQDLLHTFQELRYGSIIQVKVVL
jgi:hypothetical protein